MSLFSLIGFFSCIVGAHFISGAAPPNIVFIVADDFGWNDLSLNGSPQIPTPNIDSIASDGVVLWN
jgi:arylsulfatase B